MTKKKKVLAVASGGGHWVQLMRLKTAFQDADVVYMSTNSSFAIDVPGARLVTVPDANIWEKVAMVKMFAAVFFRVAMIRPDVVVTTGAAPGLSALMVGKLFGARTMWIDSIANSEQLSGSGKVARHFADVWLTQWEHLAADSGPQYWGGVL